MGSFVSDNQHRMPIGWTQKIEAANRVGIASISYYEVALSHKKGRLTLSSEIDIWFKEATAPAGIEILPITSEITTRAVNLSPIHKDPFDRLIMATALAYEARLATVDLLINKYPEVKNSLMT